MRALLGWGFPMQLTIKRPLLSILSIVTKLLENKALKEGEEYEYIPIEPLEPKGAGGSGKHSTPKTGEEPVATPLAKKLKSLRVTGTSENHVCYPVGDEEQTGCLYWPSPWGVLNPSDTTEGGGPSGQISPSCLLLVGKGPRGKFPLSNGTMSSRP